MNLKIIGNLLTIKFIRIGPSSYEKLIYRAAVSQSLRNTAVHVSSNSVLIIRGSTFINTASGTELSGSDCPVCTPGQSLRVLYQMLYCYSRSPDDKYSVARNM